MFNHSFLVTALSNDIYISMLVALLADLTLHAGFNSMAKTHEEKVNRRLFRLTLFSTAGCVTIFELML
ncbi:MAG: hypothetical protein DRQ44_09275 [Gammaproteobacteria bacterium]|nr:MAG: hypothetical protein DRQ44_09275 [Gammaproteobacteria bacterium]